MIQSCIDKIKYDIEISIKYHPDGFWAFLNCLKWWINSRPHKVKCEYCKEPLWVDGYRVMPTYCNENCAQADYANNYDDISF
jgi:hypothetical protein